MRFGAALLFGCLAQFTLGVCHGQSVSELPASWLEAYERLNRFIDAKQEHWPNSHLNITRDGTVDYCLTNNQANTRLSMDVIEFGARGGGWTLVRNIKTAPGSLNDKTIRLNPGIYAGSMSLSGKFCEPIVWFEVTYADKLSVSKKSKSDRIFTEIAPPLEPHLVWPNQRINYFIDLHALSTEFSRREILRENNVVQPSAVLRIRNDGVLERELFEGANYESSLRWYVYRYNELIVNRSASGETDLKIDTGYGSYRAFLCVEGLDGVLPVSNILRFPLFPKGTDQVRCIPEDQNANQVLDMLEGLVPKSQKQYELLMLWSEWRYELQSKLDRLSISTDNLIVHPAP